jgi:CRP-like cAMP-binding protein/tetratricopeptide (TPR) repeat protein
VKEDVKKLPVEGNSIEVNHEIISLDDFCTLANRLVEQTLYEEAISLYQTAGKLFPENLALKLNQGRVQELQRKHVVEKQKSIQENMSRTRAKEDLLAQQYLSLASLYYSRRKTLNAIELLELSKYKNENVSKTRYLLAKIYYEQGDVTKALEEFLKAKELDPFYEDIYKHLGTIYYEKHEHEKSLEAFIDAYILSGGEDVAKTSYYQRQIRVLLSELNVEDKKRYNRFFNEKKEYFVNLANSLSVNKDTAFEAGGDGLEHIFIKLREMERIHKSSLNVAVELRKFGVMQSFTDEELISIARITAERSVKLNEVIFREEDLTEGIYFIHRGSIRIIKETPFGEQVLAKLGAGDFFGEMDFIDSLRCSADAISNEETVLFSMSKVRLEELFLARKHVAVQFYWHFWKALSHRIREANDLLKSFFIEYSKTEQHRESAEEKPGEATTVDFQKKMAMLKEKGLSSKELRLLATFSNEQLFKAGQNIFMEGDKGDKLYIILDGQIRISKFIPGVGEEALAILEKGDFFGEMALIDKAPRSADAKAHTNATVLPIESRLLTEILSRDVESSYQFLYILCKILSRRLREINLKIFQWRMMSGGF